MLEENQFESLDDLSKSRYLEIVARYFKTEDCEDILKHSSLLQLNKTEILMSEGEEAQSMFILLDGGLDIYISQDDKPVKINEIHQGEVIGEMALIQESTRSATVTARRKSILLELSKESFDRLISTHPSLSQGLSVLLAQRLQAANKSENRNHKTDRIIHLRSFVNDHTAGFWAELVKKYWKGRKKINALEINEIGPDTYKKLCELESSSDQVLIYSNALETQEELNEFADKTIFVLGNEANPSILSEQIDRSSPFGAKDQLLLVHSNGGEPACGPWLESFESRDIFKIQEGNQAHLDRACRAITGDLICLVLGGGGAHGLSIVGVLKALNELGVPVDVIGGTSIGSILTAAIANDWDFSYIEKNVKADISQNNPLTDYTLPLVALLKGRKLRKVLNKHFNQDIANTWKNCFLVAANLSRSETEIMQSGPLDLAVLASISIPGILPPTLYKNSLMVDGGVVNNLPVDIMAKLYQGRIIAVDVVSQKKRSIDKNYRLSNFQLLKRKFKLPGSHYVPGLMGTVMKSITLSSAEKSPQKQALSDIYLSPRSKKGFLEWKAFDDFVEEGYRHTMDALKSEDLTSIFGLPEAT